MSQGSRPLISLGTFTMKVAYDPAAPGMDLSVSSIVAQNDQSGRPLTPAEQDSSDRFWDWYMGEEE